jgi:hypothetical protein
MNVHPLIAVTLYDQVREVAKVHHTDDVVGTLALDR